MKDGIPIQNGIVIPEYELEITASRSGGAGGQHVNKTATRITVRWNVKKTKALDEKQKDRVLQNLHSRLTADGDFIIHCSTTRSQQQNKELALARLAQITRKALHVPKKRTATRVPKGVKEKRLQSKKRRSTLKKLRSIKDYTD